MIILMEKFQLHLDFSLLKYNAMEMRIQHFLNGNSKINFLCHGFCQLYVLTRVVGCKTATQVWDHIQLFCAT